MTQTMQELTAFELKQIAGGATRPSGPPPSITIRPQTRR
jgi:bacteriocin-like protein